METNNIYAAKIIDKKTLMKTKSRVKLINEIKLHKKLNHENIVSFNHFFEDEENVYILLELCSNQSLNELLKRRKRLNEIEIQCYILQIIKALKYLHQHFIIHRDLKLGNCFITSNLQIKLGDFGLSAKLEYEGQRRKTVCGTPNYIAPEILEKKNGHSFEVDIWALGVILYILTFGAPPFEAKETKITYKNIKANMYTFPNLSKTDNLAIPQVKSLISSIFNLDPTKRPTLDKILEHEYFNTYSTIPKFLPQSTMACPLSKKFMTIYLKHGLLDGNGWINRKSSKALNNLNNLTPAGIKKQSNENLKYIIAIKDINDNNVLNYNLRKRDDKLFIEDFDGYKNRLAIDNTVHEVDTLREKSSGIVTIREKSSEATVKEKISGITIKEKSSGISGINTIREKSSNRTTQNKFDSTNNNLNYIADGEFKHQTPTRKSKFARQKSVNLSENLTINKKETIELKKYERVKSPRKTAFNNNTSTFLANLFEANFNEKFIKTLPSEQTYKGLKNTKFTKDSTKINTKILQSMDHSSKFGIIYYLSNKCIGICFNDFSNIILNCQEKKTDIYNEEPILYYYFEKNNLNNKSFTLETYKSYLTSKYSSKDILKKFEIFNNLMSKYNKASYWNTTKLEEIIKTQGWFSRTDVFITKFWKTSQAFIFKLSNKIIQVNFSDKSELIVYTYCADYIYIDSEGVESKETIKNGLCSGNKDLIKKIKYVKTLLLGFLNSSKQHKVETKDLGFQFFKR